MKKNDNHSKIIRRRISTTTYNNWSMRKSNILHKHAKEKDFLIHFFTVEYKNSSMRHKKGPENEPAYEKFTRL